MNVFFKKKNKTEKDEGRNGTYTEDTRTPRIYRHDLHNGLVQVVIYIPGLEPGLDRFHPKNGSVSFDFCNNGFGFDMEAVVEDKTNKLRTTYKYKVKKLPGRIDIDESKKTWDVEKGKVVVMMEKHSDSRNIDWEPAMAARGLDQESSSSSSDDDY